MRDIVEQLRIEISEDRLGHPIDVMKEAADEIERLRAELHRRTIERDYHLRMADKLVGKLRKVVEA